MQSQPLPASAVVTYPNQGEKLTKSRSCLTCRANAPTAIWCALWLVRCSLDRRCSASSRAFSFRRTCGGYVGKHVLCESRNTSGRVSRAACGVRGFLKGIPLQAHLQGLGLPGKAHALYTQDQQMERSWAAGGSRTVLPSPSPPAVLKAESRGSQVASAKRPYPA